MANIFIRGVKRLASVVDGLKNSMLARAPGRYQQSSYGAYAALSRPLPFWSLYQIEKMLLDPTVGICLATIKGPLHGAVLKATSPRPEVAALIQTTIDTFWKSSLSQALAAIEYGAAGGEIIYTQKAGQIQFERIRDFYLTDMKVLTDTDGEFGGIRAQNLKTDQAAGKVVALLGAKAFWTTHNAKHGSYYGRSQLRGAYETWYEKACQGGAIEIRRLWFYKCAFNSGSMKHPTGSTTGPDGSEIPNHDIAREIIEKMATGATVTMPSDVDPVSGKPRWEITPPAINGNATEIREYPRDLDKDICRGMGVPPEVLEANEAGGSGFAGRKVPQDAFYASEEEKLAGLLRDIKARICDPLILANFGEAIDYEIESEPLKPKEQQQQSGGAFGGQPQPGQPPGLPRPPMQQPPQQRRLSVPVPIRLATIAPPSSPDAAAFESYNEILDAITAAGIDGAAEIFEDVRRKLRDRMFPLWQTGLTEEALSQARAIVAEAEPLIARTITDSLLAAWLVGADQIAADIPQTFTQAIGFDQPPGEPPDNPLAILFPGDDDTPRIRLPQVEAAARNLAERNVMTRDEFDQLGREARQQAFTVAGQESADVIERIRGMMADLVETGPSLQEFNERLDSVLDAGGSAMNDHHRETVYRTNVQAAYSQGFDEIINHPIVVDEFPYIADSSIADARRTNVCAWFAVNGADGTNVYRADDPTYRQFSPPRHFNCRTGRIPLSIEDAAARGVREAAEWLRTGQPPEQPYRMPYPPAEILRKMFAGASAVPVGLSLSPVRLGSATQIRAPKGGVIIDGEKFPGGEWIPKHAMAKLSPMERKGLESHGIVEHRQKEQARAGKPVAKPAATSTKSASATAPSSIKIKPTKQRAYNGKQVNTDKISKQEAGKIGEEVVIAYLHSKGLKDARHMNLDRNNFPIDLVQDHAVIEVKTGQVSNNSKSHHWRLTIGEPGNAEKEWLATASAEDKAAWNAKKQKMIVERKQKALDDLSEKLGKPVKARTMTCLIDPKTKTIDLYQFDGWHDRIAWNSEMAKKAYVGSVTYG